MIIKLHEIGGNPSSFHFRLKRKELLRLDDRFSFEWMDCQARLVRGRGVIILTGRYSVEVETKCDLCLDPVTKGMNQAFDLHLVAEEDQEIPEGDIEISPDSVDVDTYRGSEINLAHCFEEQFLLDLPVVFVCREECRGICSVCGANRNKEDCHCSRQSGNSPFLILKELASKD